MPKTKTVHVCSDCGAQAARWSGQCGDCKAWNTMQEQVVSSSSAKETRHSGYAGAGRRATRKLSAVDVSATKTRFGSHNHEFDRVLGGGFVEGGVVL